MWPFWIVSQWVHPLALPFPSSSESQRSAPALPWAGALCLHPVRVFTDCNKTECKPSLGFVSSVVIDFSRLVFLFRLLQFLVARPVFRVVLVLLVILSKTSLMSINTYGFELRKCCPLSHELNISKLDRVLEARAQLQACHSDLMFASPWLYLQSRSNLSSAFEAWGAKGIRGWPPCGVCCGDGDLQEEWCKVQLWKWLLCRQRALSVTSWIVHVPFVQDGFFNHIYIN